MRALHLLSAALFGLAVAGGCGGGGASIEQFVASADKICADGNREVATITADPPDTPAEIGAQADKLLSTFDAMLARLKDVERPPGREGDAATRYVDAVERALEHQAAPALTTLREAADSGNPRTLRKAGEQVSRLEKSDDVADAARALSMKECGR
jgi:hypothetical protein